MGKSFQDKDFHKKIFFATIIIEGWLAGYRIKANCPREGFGPAGGVPSVECLCKGPTSFGENHGKLRMARLTKHDRRLNPNN